MYHSRVITKILNYFTYSSFQNFPLSKILINFNCYGELKNKPTFYALFLKMLDVSKYELYKYLLLNKLIWLLKQSNFLVDEVFLTHNSQ